MDTEVHERTLPPGHRIAGWVLIACFPVLTVAASYLAILILMRLVPYAHVVAAELPTGQAPVAAVYSLLSLGGLFTPLMALLGYRAWLHRRYAACRLDGEFASFRMPFASEHVVRVAELTRRRPTRHGLLVKHPHTAGWLLIPSDDEQAAGRLSKALDDRVHAQRTVDPPPGLPARPSDSRLAIEFSSPQELVVSWPLIREEKVRSTWLLALALTPLCGVGLLLVPGLVLRHRRRNRLRLTPELLRLRSGVPFTGFARTLRPERIDRFECSDLTLKARSRGRRFDLLDAVALQLADVAWLHATLLAWHEGELLTRGAL